MPALRHDIDPDGLLEYSVVYTDRSLNHMSKVFGQVMRDLSSELKSLYHADAVAIVPGSGTSGMEAVVRAFADDKNCVVVRNGWFSYRWTQILEASRVAKSCEVFCAEQVQPAGEKAQFAPADLAKVSDFIREHKPDVVFAPHVETASGMMLSDEYIAGLAKAAHDVGALLVIDSIASGCVWLDMKALGIDVLISAPQKGLSSTPCAGLVMMNDKAAGLLANATPSSFALDLKAWHGIMQAYENGGHAYHATMPTDSLRQLRDALLEAKAVGYETLKSAQIELGKRIVALLAEKGVASVAHPDCQARGVVVCHAPSEAVHKGAAFAEQGLQIAAGTPLKVGEPEDYQSFRIGLFGLDKLTDVDGAVARFQAAADKVFG
ncbi:class V aminotransferase [Moraxella caviae]|uniref:Class V aminotransferase n=1 Tax=Moraxella caviae TaxID=34060 RepID=A0A1T0A5K2_9GAMM|nr:aminotransferase class V-fold PLP-dependent enzyme [Moraxella caviae]OOR90849.1 class V aminotransferase [Moraxella caviae]STZ10684.1 Soluble hydrogenase 42 kDa subunit [Moraxella caviae]